MMGIGKVVGKIFSPGKLGDSLISGIDKAILTKEENIDYMKEMLPLYEPYKLAQRLIAIMFTGVFLLTHIMNAIVYFIYVLSDKYTHVLSDKESVNIYKNDHLDYAVLTIVGFYFAGGVFEGIATKVKAKRDKKRLKEE